MALESDTDDRTLYIGNMDRNVTEEIIYELFLQAGPIERVSIPCSNNDSYRYGFVTYKHDCSIDYAIELYKGTNLFKKELSIKRKGARNNNNGQQSNDHSKYPALDSGQARLSSGFPEFSQDQLCNFQQNFLLNMNTNFPPLVNFTSNSLKGNWSSWNKPYDRGSRNHPSRHREIRDRRKDRDYGNKLYHGRKNRHRD